MNPDISILLAQANNTQEILKHNYSFYQEFKNKEFQMLGQSTATAMVFSQIYLDFYTCIETFLFRVSQVFENNLDPVKWHKELLYKMTLNIDGIRPAVLSHKSFISLDELLRFRHFRRYYFNFDYDWDKLDLIEKKYIQAQPSIQHDIETFKNFLQHLNEK